MRIFEFFLLKEGQLDCTRKFCRNCYNDNLKLVNFNHCKNIQCVEYIENEKVEEIREDFLLNVISPKEEILNSRGILLKIESNEPVDLSYGLGSTGRFRRFARNVKEVEKRISLRDGENNLIIKSVDERGKVTTKEMNLFVDSKKPRIRSYTREKFINEKFEIKVREDNLKEINLFINNKKFDVSLDNCEEDRSYFICSFDIDLKEFDGEEIEYYFEVIDIAGNKDESRELKAKVDLTPPQIENINISYEERRSRYNVKLKIDETNFDEVNYIYNYRDRERERRFCSRLRDGICERTIYEKYENIKLEIKDEAGNILIKEINLKGGSSE